VRRHVVSPIGFATAALALALVYGALHLAGLRDDASFLSGTEPPDAFGTPLGLAYVIAYFAFVVAAPILAIAAALWALANKLIEK
jgi:hypothetical protein